MDFVPATDRKGNHIVPGDRVSIKLYPRGTAEGTVVVSECAKQLHQGVWLPLLSVDVDGVRYSLTTGGTLKLRSGR